MNKRGEALRSNGLWLLALGFLMFAGGIPASNAQDITTDPFVQQELDRSNWEPGGSRFPSTFFARGSIIISGGTVVVSPLPELQVGSFVLQQGVVSGQYTYTIDLTAPHGFTVHSPFDVTTTASDTASLKTPTQEIDVFLSWDGQLHHPADGYDAPTGGGFPPATGARDEFTFDITGNVSGLFFVTTSNGSAFAGTQPGLIPTSSSSFSVNGTVSGGQVNGGLQQASVTQQGIALQGSINPNGAYQLNSGRYNNNTAGTTPQTTEPGVFFSPATSLFKAWNPPHSAAFVPSASSGGDAALDYFLSNEEIPKPSGYFAERNAIAIEYVFDNDIFLKEFESAVIIYGAMMGGVPTTFSSVLLTIKDQFVRDTKAIEEGKNFNYWKESMLGILEVVLPDMGTLPALKVALTFASVYIYGFFRGI